jgi:hypothetical protein
MLDLTLSLAGMMILCVLAAIGGAILQRQAGQRTVLFAQMLAAAGMAGYMAWLWDRPLLIELLPFSCAIILGNWLPVLGAFFVGICLQTQRIMRIRRMLLGTTLGCLCCYSLSCPLLGEAPECQPPALQDERIFRCQTTDQTCSAACAAGLLRLHGIPATEDELAQLCLTRRGTHWLGVFRGLKIKTAGTEWDVVVEEVTPGRLTQVTNPLGILALTFSPSAAAQSAESGFGTEVGHTVISLAASKWGTLEVFDPSPDYGFESWNDRVLADVEKCILLRLVSRNGSRSPLQPLDAKHFPPSWIVPSVASR